MSKVTPFPAHARARDLKEHMVFVTFAFPWKGVTPEHSACEAAKAICATSEHVADFYGKCCVTWGSLEENPPAK